MGNFSDIFESFFGGSARTSRRSPEAQLRGRDVEVNLKIAFEEAAFGATKKVSVSRLVPCSFCNGTGAVDGKLITCDKCGGIGQIKVSQRTILGVITQTRICDVCKGLGKKPDKICRHCR